jgi:hypothetical protein
MRDTIEPLTELDDDEQLWIVHRLIDQPRECGIDLVGPGGVLSGLTKTVLETALEEETPDTAAMTSTTRRGATATTRATGPAPRPCAPRSAQSRSRSRATGHDDERWAAAGRARAGGQGTELTP